MHFEMICSCGASIAINSTKDRDEASWLLCNRFASAHASCGYVTPLKDENPASTKTFNALANPDKDSQ